MKRMKKVVCWMSAFVFAVSTLASVGAPAFAAVNPPAEPNTDGYYFWKVESKTYEGYSYGDWKNITSFVVSSKNAPMDITFSVSKKYDNKVTGTIKVANSTLESTMGYDLDASIEVSLTATKKNAPAGTYYLKARPVYKYWKVKQQRYYRIDGTTTKSGSPVYCYPKKFDHAQTTVA